MRSDKMPDAKIDWLGESPSERVEKETVTTQVQPAQALRPQHGDDGRFLKGNSIACRPNKKLKRHRGELDYLRELVSKYGPEGHNKVLDAIIAHATDDTSDKQTQAWTLLCKYVYGKVPLSDLNSRTVIG